MVSWIVSSSILIICVVLIRCLLKGRISPRLQYALWGIVLLRLLIPFNFGNSKISVENFTDYIAEAYESEAVWEIEHYDTDSSFGKAYLISADTSLVSSGNDKAPAAGNVEQNVTNALVWVNNALVYIWAAGMVAVALVFIYTNLRFVIRTSKDRELIVGKENGIPPIYYSDGVETPCLYGILNPRIYVNAEAFDDEHVFKHVKEHELTHYHHGDNIWCVFRFMALIVHWYNPLVWLAAALSRKDSELACDEGTIKRLGENERVGYDMTLINMSCKRREAVFAMVTTMAGSKKNIQERVVLIAKKPKTAMRTLVDMQTE